MKLRNSFKTIEIERPEILTKEVLQKILSINNEKPGKPIKW